MSSRRTFIRRFLQGAGCFAVAAHLPGFPTLSAAGLDRPGQYHFPHGLASGDPTPSSVVLWTRVTPTSDARPDAIPLIVQVAPSPDFAHVVAEQQLVANASDDFTVRVLVHDLAPDTRYFYRFLAAGDVSALTGRTRTAPRPDSDRAIRFAFASCQSYEGGFYSAYRTLIEEDKAAAPEEQLDFVLHLGDYIYEVQGYGGARHLPDFPSGGATMDDDVDWARRHAVTLADYRHLYKTYLTDPDLREARARWPFLVTWDDHEFSDDCWQGMATFTPEGEPAQERKVAANQAWFEYIPALLTGSPSVGDVPSQAADFEPVEVENAPLTDFDDHGLSREPNNLAAIESLTIYRSFRWGQHVALVLTDTRSYRSAHPVPGPMGVEISGNARYIAPLPLVQALDAGRTFENGQPPETITLGAQEVPNVRRDAPPGTMLGAQQKQWLKGVLQASDATWKLLGTSVPLMPMRLDLDQIDPDAVPAAFTIDTWEGYPSEREELLGFMAEAGMTNIVSLAGDNHNSFAGYLARSYEEDTLEPIGAEFSVCGISSTSVWQAMEGIVAPGEPFRPLVALDRPGAPPLEALNMTFRHGTRASATLTETGGNLEAAIAQRNPDQNPHLTYVDSNAYGFARLEVTGERAACTFTTIAPPVEQTNGAGATVLRRVRHTLPAWTADDEPLLQGPTIEGTPPFPMGQTA